MNSSKASHHGASSSSSASTLRPRTRRLISGFDDEITSERQASPARSRPVSSSNSTSRDGGARVRFDPEPADQSSVVQPRSFSGAWSQISGFASSLWGAESPPPPGKRRLNYNITGKAPNSTTPSEWGPSGMAQDQIGAGYNSDRVSLVRDAKRKVLLSSNGAALNDPSRHKRKNSDDIQSTMRGLEDGAEVDALVYIHQVKPGDTLAGLTIKYNCNANILRKANRMWPNDPIHTRKTILVPVDSCTVKGRPVSGPEDTKQVDLLDDENIVMHESPDLSKTSHNGSTFGQLNTYTSPQLRPLSPSISQADAEPPWKHESWVLLPNDTKPTEVARLSRQNLGYFPRARRKSMTFSDIGTSRTTSFDLTSRPTIPPSPNLLPTQPTGYTSPSRRPASNARPINNRSRSSSNTMANLLHGPGGVGSLGRHSRTIGPATDRLTELLAPHLPNVDPPSYQTVFTPWAPGLLEDDDATSRSAMSGVPSEGMSASTLDLQDVGGAIEGWVRKMAKKAATALETNAATSTAKAKSNVGVQGLGLGSGMGDLIELVDAFEIGEGDELSDPNAVLVGNTTTNTETPSSNLNTSSSNTGEMRGRKPTRHDSFSKLGKGD